MKKTNNFEEKDNLRCNWYWSNDCIYCINSGCGCSICRNYPTGEKLQQNAQQTGDDTQREIGGKITINSAYINDATTMRLYFESASR